MRTPPCYLASLAALLVAIPACSSSSGSNPGTPAGDAAVLDADTDAASDAGPLDAAPDAAPDGEAGTEPDGGAPDGQPDATSDGNSGGNDGTLPPIQEQTGVVYAVHYHTGDLIWYRTDGATPRREGSLDMVEVSHDAVLDPVHDRLFVAHDVAKKVEIYQLGRPADASSDTPQPSLSATLDFEYQPYFVRVNPYRERLYVLQTLPGSGGPVTESALFIYDVTDPAAPALLDGSPHTIPSTASLDIDPVRDLLFLFHGPDGSLHGFDLHGDDVQPIPGGEIDLEGLYPQDNSYAFQARNLTVDPYNHRIYAARAQGNLSELIALSYADDIPTGGATYSQYGSMTDLTVIEDAFDVDLPLDERPHLLDAFTAVPDPEAGAVFFVGSSWNGTASTSMVLSMPTALDGLDEGCAAFEGFGCWYRSYADANAGAYKMTDGAACADLTHQVFVGMSYDVYDETNPGMLHMFDYDDARNLDVWLPDDGGNLMAGALPISLVCH